MAQAGLRALTGFVSRFVLASASPRRRDLLRSVGLLPEVMPSDIDERWHSGEAPVAYALRVAVAKAEACVAPWAALAADTVVAQGDTVFLKTADSEEVRRTLLQLSGKSHTVYTAVAVREGEPGTPVRTLYVATDVRFRRLCRADVERYLATKEPFDKAGSYGIQGAGGSLVASVQGSYTNVVGLPLEETLDLLKKCGLWREEA